MKDKLKVGMYVRTNDGYIGKLLKIEEDYEYSGFSMAEENKRFKCYKYVFDDQIWDTRLSDGWSDPEELLDDEIEDLTIEPSFDIMDMIREGDYVNGHPVRNIYTINNKKALLLNRIEKSHYDYENFVYEKDIKTILTKELFESYTYHVFRKGE